MSRFVTDIQKPSSAKRQKSNITTVILAAGCGNKIKSYEPRSLLKIKEDHLISHQINSINESLSNPEIITVVGCCKERVIKKTRGRTRIVENQNFDTTNSAESIRLAFNNTLNQKFLFAHGDLYFNPECLKVSYDKSFIIIDSRGKMRDDEVGVTVCDGKLSIMSYGLPTKWCQIAFFTGKEFKLLKGILNRYKDIDKTKLSFELINSVVDAGGKFHCYEPKKMNILEIDRIKDLKENEDLNCE